MSSKYKPPPVKSNSKGEEFWELQTIITHRKAKDGTFEFFVKWKGWPSSDNTWEPVESLRKCPEALGDYWTRVTANTLDRSKTTAQRKRKTRSHTLQAVSPDYPDPDDDSGAKLVIDIPPPTSSRRSELIRPRSETPNSSSESEEYSSDGSDARQTKRAHIPSSNDLDLDNIGDISLSQGRGKGKAYTPPPDPDSDEESPSPNFQCYISFPADATPGELSGMSTKRRFQKGSMAIRRPLDFYDKGTFRVKPSTSTKSKDILPKVTYIPIGQNFKPPVPRVTARIVADSHENVYANEDPVSYTGLYRINEGTIIGQESESQSQSRQNENEEVFLGIISSFETASPKECLGCSSSPSSSSFPPRTREDGVETMLPTSSPSAPQPDRASLLVTDDVVQQAEGEAYLTSAFKIEKNVQDWLNANSASSCYSFTSPGLSNSAATEMARLHAYIERTHPESNMSTADIIFAHITQIQELSLCTGLLRAKEMKPVFIVYGTDSLGKSCNMDEVYPFGGAITFTTGTLVNDVDFLMRKLREVAMHPLWDVYLVPSVLGLAIKKYYGEIEIWKSLDNNFAFAELLDLVDEDLVCLMSNPEASEDEWNFHQQTLRLLSHEEIVKLCVDAAPTRGIQQDSAMLEVNEEVANNLRMLQIRPKFFTEFRRYVVLTKGSERMIPGNELEILTAQTFDISES
ncbi:hypothetical protein J3R30DRAFT_3760104 [Lentinula aciculospora]|uniref:Chromo domain-containing protein n=1 Tax=Lentinula aciculospora TaxID=153920 RepID=A0A9W9A916_9AGAR|nr:hypothetical protein J3R30DRAFT_3760104 [Lentinula aciculospora]